MPGRKSAEKELQWREIFKQQVDSGLSIRQSCLTQSVSLPSSYAWHRRLRTPMVHGAAVTRTTVAPQDSRAQLSLILDGIAQAHIAYLEALLGQSQETIAEQQQTSITWPLKTRY